MKRLRILSIVMVMFSAIAFTSCDTEPLDPKLVDGGDDSAAASFMVDFSGKTFKATSAKAIMAEGMISIEGVRGSKGEAISLLIEGATTGTYTDALMEYLPTATSEDYYMNVDPTSDDDGASTGSVTITSINTAKKTISGTFNFTGFWTDAAANHPSIAFTNGSFTDIPYTTTSTGPGDGDSDEYLRAKVNGVSKDYSAVGYTLGSDIYLTLNGSSPVDDDNLAVAMDVNITPGTYTMGSSVFDGNPAGSYSVGDTNYVSDTGTLVIISKTNGFIKGTFSFTGHQRNNDSNIITVTNGEFYIDIN